MRMHLTGENQATACGLNVGWGVQDTREPKNVTCARCKATAWFKLCTASAAGKVIDLMVALADSLKQSKVSAGETETRT